MPKQPLSYLDLPLEHRNTEDIETVLMSGSNSGDVFDDLRQRYERRVEQESLELLDGEPLSNHPEPDRTDREISLEPDVDLVQGEAEVPWYAWMLVLASFLTLLVTAAAAILVIV